MGGTIYHAEPSIDRDQGPRTPFYGTFLMDQKGKKRWPLNVFATHLGVC